MKTKELFELVNQGAKPVIRVVGGTDFEGPDNGMLGRITSVGSVDVWDKENSTVEFVIDFKEFEEINIPFAKKDWYDSNHVPCLTWIETKYYEKEVESFGIFEMLRENQQDAELSLIELVEENKRFAEYLKTDKKLSYTQYLESQLDMVQAWVAKI